ncbi:DUF2190 family protein [Sphingomonas desiccabilis]|uniref:DUF2190 family protein n=1 Tax=Sphingomonas desiccabilis TaxID=429134 RepID=A0A4V1QPY8_9SPHN|nr:capsid cement protein [Sphingomonas desiccabilis]MBB3910842.1 putative RecA/RadA family phage recombinase [Sphingomonas desiccabilis]RXZ35447.1 DUF2190 family protein [Sphingomonas desiccabilis]
MKNHIQPGVNLTLTAPRDLASGEGFLVGSIFAVASTAAKAGEQVVGVTEQVFDLPKATGAVTQGAKAYWDDAAHNVTTVAGGVLIGAFVDPAASAAATARVKLTGQIAA